jgi:hypothetical protein
MDQTCPHEIYSSANCNVFLALREQGDRTNRYFLDAVFLVADFLAVAFFTAAFLAGAAVVSVSAAVDFFAAVFFDGVFFAAAFFAGAFLAADPPTTFVTVLSAASTILLAVFLTALGTLADVGKLFAISFAFAPAIPPTIAPTAAPTGPSIDPAAAPAAAPPTIPRPEALELSTDFFAFAMTVPFLVYLCRCIVPSSRPDREKCDDLRSYRNLPIWSLIKRHSIAM